MNLFLKSTLAAFALGACFASPVIATDKPGTMLVLDASGSMWGQIDGVNKITIAREVVENILSDFPLDQNLGFVTYGHRERGQCSDIQTIIEPAPDTAHEIIKIVNELNPRGMTPMTDAVIVAAEALRHTEQPATVILVSDGIETCNPDPCAAARALEQSGIDFTAHVIGFDVRGEAEALMQMQCIAEETGGRFLTADNAEELSAALQEVTQVALSQTATVTLVAQEATEEVGYDPVWHVLEQPLDNPMLEGNVSWTIYDADSYIVMEETFGNPLHVDLPMGDYILSVYSEQRDMSGEHNIIVGDTQNFAATALFPEPIIGSVWFRAVLDSEDGPEVTDPIIWTIEGENSKIEWEHNPLLYSLESGMYSVSAYHVVFEQTQTTEIAVVAGTERTVNVVFETPTPTATLIAPGNAAAGSVIEIGWVGPEAEKDNIQIAHVGGQYINWIYTRTGNPVRLQMPAQPGEYELRYEFAGKEIIASKPITITETKVDFISPASAAAGSVIEIGWVGPNADKDNIQIAPVGGDYYSWQYTRSGNPVQLQMPAQPGEYELRYEFAGREIIATKPITITETEVDFTSPASAPAGSVIEIGWVGPNADRDNIQIAPIGGQYYSWQYTRSGNPIRLQLPAQAGEYELRYEFAGTEIIATKPITLTPIEIDLVAPASAPAGSEIEIGWIGPDAEKDNIQIAHIGGSYINWAYTRSGSPLRLKMPDEPGNYELRYSFRDREILITRPITITAAE